MAGPTPEEVADALVPRQHYWVSNAKGSETFYPTCHRPGEGRHLYASGWGVASRDYQPGVPACQDCLAQLQALTVLALGPPRPRK